MTKPVARWTQQDAKQVLTSSPWAKDVRVAIGRRPSEDELRDGGRMGQPQGVGYQGLDPDHKAVNIPDNIFKGGARGAPYVAPIVVLKLRWESALPVRLAELKLPDSSLDDLGGDGYSIAVWNIPGGFFEGDPKKQGDPLKENAWLKREGRKSVSPSSVLVLNREDGGVVVYSFPLSAEISTKDTWVTFEAHMGRLTIFHPFNVSEMQFQGKPAL